MTIITFAARHRWCWKQAMQKDCQYTEAHRGVKLVNYEPKAIRMAVSSVHIARLGAKQKQSKAKEKCFSTLGA